MEYVDAVLAKLGRPPLCALNVPNELRGDAYIASQVYDAQEGAEIEHILSKLEKNARLLIKPGDTPKRFDAPGRWDAGYFHFGEWGQCSTGGTPVYCVRPLWL